MYKPRKRKGMWIFQARDGVYYTAASLPKALLGIVSPCPLFLPTSNPSEYLKQLYFSKERR